MKNKGKTSRNGRWWIRTFVWMTLTTPALVFAADGVLVSDAHISSSQPALNYGGLPNLQVTAGVTALVQFDLSTLPAGTTGAMVAKANLILYVNRIGTSGLIDIAPVTSSWTEAAVTFATRPLVGLNISTGEAVTQSSAFLVIEVTSQVQSWINSPSANFGFVISPSGAAPATNVFLDSKESTGTSHPAQLEIELIGPQGPAGVTGAPGPQGIVGPAGSTGPVGPQGPAGSVTLPYNAAANSPAIAAFSVQNTSTTFGSYGIAGKGGDGVTGTDGVHGIGGTGGASGNGGFGLVGQGGSGGTGGVGGIGTFSLGGSADITSRGGIGIQTFGGEGGVGGAGIVANAGTTLAANSSGNNGVLATGGAGTGNSNGGAGVVGQGGPPGPHGTGGVGVKGQGAQGLETVGISHPGGAGGRFVGGDGPRAAGVGVIGFGGNITGPETAAAGGLFEGGTSVSGIGGDGIDVFPGPHTQAGSFAAFFGGDVQVAGTLSKTAGSFKIDHPLAPESKYLYHSFVESPDMMNIYNGIVTLDSGGRALVTLPDWFEALNGDFRYQLTAVGSPAPNLHVSRKVQNLAFEIAGGHAGLEVSWQVTGIRHDAYANAHRIPVVEDKTPSELGYYLNPDSFGQSEEKSIRWVTHPEQMLRLQKNRQDTAAPPKSDQ